MISQKAKYALRALVSLARAGRGETRMIGEISKEQSIPKKFLEQILLELKRAGFVDTGVPDDHPADAVTPTSYVTASTEAVPLSSIKSVVINRVVTDPMRYHGGISPQEVTVTIGWGAVSRLDLEPASCGDPECDADHGYTGTASADDIALRVSEAAEGADAVARMLDFAAALSRATGR